MNTEIKSEYPGQSDVMKLKTVAIFIAGGHFNEVKSMTFRRLASVAGCVQSFMSVDPEFLNIGQN